MDKGRVVFVLLLVQSGLILLAMVGELIFMGGLFFYALVPLVRIVMTIVFGVQAMRGKQIGLVGLIVLQGLSLVGFGLSLAVGLLPALDFTPTLTGVFTTAILPLVIIVYCSQLLTAQRAAARRRIAPLPAATKVEVAA